MVKFDYSYVKAPFEELSNGDCFITDEKSESLYMKVSTVQKVSILEPTKKPKFYDCYSFNDNEFKLVDKDTVVIKCNIDIIAKPQI